MTIGRRRSDSGDGASNRDALRALVADDDANFRHYISSVATRLGFVVEEACDGEEAMSATRQRTFDLLILDQAMPRLTGLEMIGQLRDAESTRNTYAVMLTAHDDSATKIAALTAGYDDFVTKASTELEIVAKIVAARRLVARQRLLDRTLHELYGLATRDELTALFNRRFFLSEIERHIVRRAPLTLVLFDLDDFKHINDTYGHLAGDRILRDVGALFLRTTRTEDLVARYGGDEFVMMVANLPIPEVEKIAERITADIAGLQWSIGQERLAIGATTGIASTIIEPATSVLELLDVADRDLYKNKWLRKNGTVPVVSRGMDVVVPITAEQEINESGGDAATLQTISRMLPPERPTIP